MKIWVWAAPALYVEWVGKEILLQVCGDRQIPDLVHLFARTKTRMENSLRKLAPLLIRNPALIIWVSWYKKSSKIPTDLSEDLIREYALGNGLVDVKVCSVSDEWSALKLVVPLKNR